MCVCVLGELQNVLGFVFILIVCVNAYKKLIAIKF